MKKKISMVTSINNQILLSGTNLLLIIKTFQSKLIIDFNLEK